MAFSVVFWNWVHLIINVFLRWCSVIIRTVCGGNDDRSRPVVVDDVLRCFHRAGLAALYITPEPLLRSSTVAWTSLSGLTVIFSSAWLPLFWPPLISSSYILWLPRSEWKLQFLWTFAVSKETWLFESFYLRDKYYSKDLLSKNSITKGNFGTSNSCWWVLNLPKMSTQCIAFALLQYNVAVKFSLCCAVCLRLVGERMTRDYESHQPTRVISCQAVTPSCSFSLQIPAGGGWGGGGLLILNGVILFLYLLFASW